MGYCVSVKFKSVEEKDIMYNFLTENLDLLKKLEKTDYIYFSIHPAVNENIGAYAPKTSRDKLIGFQGRIIPLYAFDLCCWIANKSLYRNKNGSSVVFYDKKPIELFVDGNVQTNTNINKQGLPIRENNSIMHKIKQSLTGNKEAKQYDILNELNNLWNKKLNNLNKPKM